MSQKIIPIFNTPGINHPADILDNAAAVTRFLCDIAPAISSDNSDASLSDKGAHGLFLILESLEKSIEAAANAI